jgi:endonuclease/exonuclease/phosphatase (EEP) superfamily protein YafD
MKSDFWVFRITEYLRLQKLIIAVIVAAIIFVFRDNVGYGWLWLFVPLCLCIVYLVKEVMPYTVLGFKEVIDTKERKADASFKIFSANVLMSNDDYGSMLEQISSEDPDIIFLLEAGRDWDAATTILKDKYPYSLKEPIDNTYGLLFYSRLKIKDASINYIVASDVPSIELTIILPNGTEVKAYGLHPKPPIPYEASHSTEKDKELMKVALTIKDRMDPCIVFGDLNDVAWSDTTELFRDISGMLDPRLGRGFFTTFSAKSYIMRFPLDYLFASPHFSLIQMKKMPANGSDHFAMSISLQYEEGCPSKRKNPPSKEHIKKAIEKATA